MEYYKTVLIPTKVCVGDYCWSHNRDDSANPSHDRICPHFDNENNVPTCDLGLGALSYDEQNWVPKPRRCKELKEV